MKVKHIPWYLAFRVTIYIHNKVLSKINEEVIVEIRIAGKCYLLTLWMAL